MAISTKSISGKYLTFLLGDESYGVEIMKIKEIIGMIPVTTLPKTPSYVKGIINLRGKVIPVIDLRSKFGLASKNTTERTCIVVTEIKKSDGIVLLSFIVDSVSEVINITADDIESAPSFGPNSVPENISGVAKRDKKIIILLDIEAVLAAKHSAICRKAA
ncbi:MAG: chemotaxis protein CheW [Proteobacteria bacterium]|nr:chemotaxis protein CheW [Pseudomonadota bacterium]MBU0967090.1 chemotaxis protein CheW [Pseudomonadota bacterium]